jgi:hypothetical protein
MTYAWRTTKRRLSDDILVAFHQACDQDDIEVARRLLKVFRVHDAAAAGWSWW